MFRSVILNTIHTNQGTSRHKLIPQKTMTSDTNLYEEECKCPTGFSETDILALGAKRVTQGHPSVTHEYMAQ